MCVLVLTQVVDSQVVLQAWNFNAMNQGMKCCLEGVFIQLNLVI